MRLRLRALVGILIVGACVCNAAAAEPGSRWWPFGRREVEESQPPASVASSRTTAPSPVGQQAPLPQEPADDQPEQRWMIDSPMAKVSWPRIHLPEVPSLQRPQFWPKKSDVDAARNAWAEQNPTATQPSPLQAVADGARRVGDSTRAAWHKTVDAITPGDSSDGNNSRIARRQARPPFWKRMFGAEQWQPEGPQTVTEWMAQERLDP